MIDPGTISVILIGGLALLLAVGAPVSISIGLPSALCMLLIVDFQRGAITAAQQMIGGTNSFALLAIPFFILAGGYVRVTRGKRTLSVLTGGDCFGEMSYLAQKASPERSATVTTTSDCIVMKIRAEDLRVASTSCRRLFDERE